MIDTSSEPHRHVVQVYYEDTDLTGSVYHSNYLAYFERAREHCLGVKELVRLYREEGKGFVVYHVDITYRAPSVHGDELEILSVARCESDYRVIFEQRARGPRETSDRVIAKVTLVCIKDEHLVPIPPEVREAVAQRFGGPTG